jgi:glycosyltransferase involved in cell wall biosynthesis
VSAPGRRKILFFIWALEVGGAERFLVKLAKRIPKESFETKVVCLSRKGAWAHELEQAGIAVLCLDKRTGFDPGILFRLLALIRRERPDLVNTHLWTADLWARLAAVLAGVPSIVVTEQNVDVWKRWYHRVIDRALFLRTSLVICVSEEVRAFYRGRMGVPERKLRMIPNAIDLAPFDAPAPSATLRHEIEAGADDFLFVCAARLHPQKAHPVLIEAARLLVARGTTSFCVLLCGDGELRPELEALVASHGLGGRIRFLGIRQDMPSVFQQCDAFVLASLYEGLPLSILEAMAARLPVIATRVGGNAEVVQDGRTGLLVPAREPQALADAMGALIGDRQRARTLGAAGGERVRSEYGIETVAARTLRAFEECLGAAS